MLKFLQQIRHKEPLFKIEILVDIYAHHFLASDIPYAVCLALGFTFSQQLFSWQRDKFRVFNSIRCIAVSCNSAGIIIEICHLKQLRILLQQPIKVLALLRIRIFGVFSIHIYCYYILISFE